MKDKIISMELGEIIGSYDHMITGKLSKSLSKELLVAIALNIIEDVRLVLNPNLLI